MTWNTHATIQVQNLVSQISTDLQATGWTLYDNVSGAPVLSSTNNQGVVQYLQVSQGGTYQYLQFQGWQSWNASTHVGTNGSGTTNGRLYFAGSVQGATVTLDMYTSVTANRLIVVLNGVGLYRDWAYLGGLGALCPATDPYCFVVLTGRWNQAAVNACGFVLQAAVGAGGTFWQNISLVIFGGIQTSQSEGLTPGLFRMGAPMLGMDTTRLLMSPVLVSDNSSPASLRGDLDGLFQMSGSGTILANMDTLTVSGITYLVVYPGGSVASYNHVLSGGYTDYVLVSET